MNHFPVKIIFMKHLLTFDSSIPSKMSQTDFQEFRARYVSLKTHRRKHLAKNAIILRFRATNNRSLSRPTDNNQTRNAPVTPAIMKERRTTLMSCICNRNPDEGAIPTLFRLFHGRTPRTFSMNTITFRSRLICSG